MNMSMETFIIDCLVFEQKMFDNGCLENMLADKKNFKKTLFECGMLKLGLVSIRREENRWKS